MFIRKSAVGNRQSPGFSLVELLVVIGIIAVLISVLIPTIRKIRISGQEADTKALLNQLDAAITAYYADANGYPGPLPDAVLIGIQPPAAANWPQYVISPPAGFPIYPGNTNGFTFNDGTTSGLATPFNTGTVNANTPPAANVLNGSRVTSSENLLLGLCGGLAIDRTVVPPKLYFDKDAVGQGAMSFNPRRAGRSTPYMQKVSVSDGRIRNAVYGTPGLTGDEFANDSIIPEFVDKFSAPMPFLYLRSRQNGVSDTTIAPIADGQTLVTQDPTVAAFDYSMVLLQPYTTNSVGGDFGLAEGDYVNVTYNNRRPHGLQSATYQRTIDKNNKIAGYNTYAYPYDAYDYFVDPTSYDRTQNVSGADLNKLMVGKRSRKRDSYVLISAGRDRIYGTADDIANFGSVQP